jgi:hypothetical protein
MQLRMFMPALLAHESAGYEYRADQTSRITWCRALGSAELPPYRGY